MITWVRNQSFYAAKNLLKDVFGMVRYDKKTSLDQYRRAHEARGFITLKSDVSANYIQQLYIEVLNGSCLYIFMMFRYLDFTLS